jgi:hypothetical protein
MIIEGSKVRVWYDTGTKNQFPAVVYFKHFQFTTDGIALVCVTQAIGGDLLINMRKVLCIEEVLE